MKKICVHPEKVQNLCSSRKEKGFALLTVMFMLVSLISLVFLTAYLPIAERKEDSRVAKEAMDIHRYFRGILGRSAEQCGGKFMACGGFVSDIQEGGGSVTPTTFSRIYGRRLAGKNVSTSAGWAFYYPAPWRYHRGGFWAGWRGKRYMHRLPCDDWDEKRILSKDRSSFHTKKVFLTGTGKTLSLKTACGSAWIFELLDQDGKLKGETAFSGGSHHYIIVKDYKKNKVDEVKVVLFGSTNNRRAMTGDYSTAYPKGETPEWDHYHEYEDKGDYILHVFKLLYNPSNTAFAKLYAFSGLKNAMVYINGKPKYSVPLVLPPRSCTFMTIDYYG